MFEQATEGVNMDLTKFNTFPAMPCATLLVSRKCPKIVTKNVTQNVNTNNQFSHNSSHKHSLTQVRVVQAPKEGGVPLSTETVAPELWVRTWIQPVSTSYPCFLCSPSLYPPCLYWPCLFLLGGKGAEYPRTSLQSWFVWFHTMCANCSGATSLRWYLLLFLTTTKQCYTMLHNATRHNVMKRN